MELTSLKVLYLWEWYFFQEPEPVQEDLQVPLLPEPEVYG